MHRMLQFLLLQVSLVSPRRPLLKVSALLALMASLASAATPAATFRFTYAGAITNVPAGQTARIWLPLARNTTHQFVTRKIVHPAKFETTVESRFGNELLYFEAQADADGKIRFEVSYDVHRIAADSSNRATVTAHDRQLFMQDSALVPSDLGLTSKLLAGKTLNDDVPAEATRTLYDAVWDHMRYDKPAGKPWGRGDAAWACDSRFGNCTDFHSLFIAGLRSHGIPARFEMGFPIPAESGAVGGYHCWAAFVQDSRWVPVDISEADKHPELKETLYGTLPPDRVAFTIGRDLELVPQPAAKSVNFLVYPYVEIDGEEHRSFEKAFRVEHYQPSR